MVRRYVDWPDVAGMASNLDFTKLPELVRYSGQPPQSGPLFHFEIDMNPYQAGPGQKGASIVAMYKLPYTPASPCRVVHQEQGVDVLAIVGGLSTALPFFIARVTDLEFHSIWDDSDPCTDLGPRGNISMQRRLKEDR